MIGHHVYEKEIKFHKLVELEDAQVYRCFQAVNFHVTANKLDNGVLLYLGDA